jgi:hypothetical protein
MKEAMLCKFLCFVCLCVCSIADSMQENDEIGMRAWFFQVREDETIRQCTDKKFPKLVIRFHLGNL